jgi:hypothetical protein
MSSKRSDVDAGHASYGPASSVTASTDISKGPSSTEDCPSVGMVGLDENGSVASFKSVEPAVGDHNVS